MGPKWGYTAVIAWGSRGEGVVQGGGGALRYSTGKEVQGVLFGEAGGGLELALGDFLGGKLLDLFSGFMQKRVDFFDWCSGPLDMTGRCKQGPSC